MDQDQDQQNEQEQEVELELELEHEPEQLLTVSPSGQVRIGSGSDAFSNNYDNNYWVLRPDRQPVAHGPNNQVVVSVSIYDLHWTNQYTRIVGMAAYHSGIVLNDIEIAYGGDGVYTMTPQKVSDTNMNMVYRKSVLLGMTSFTQEDAVLIAKALGEHGGYTGSNYDILRRNCNHFSAALGRLLCPNSKFPRRINILAKVLTKLSKLPFVGRGIRHFTTADTEAGSDGEGKGDGDSGMSCGEKNNSSSEQQQIEADA